MELIFFTAAPTVLCFGFVANTVLIEDQYWLLLDSACTASRLPLSPALPIPSKEGTSLRHQSIILYYISFRFMLDDKNWSRGEVFS